MDRATRRETVVGLAHNVVEYGRDRDKERQRAARLRRAGILHQRLAAVMASANPTIADVGKR